MKFKVEQIEENEGLSEEDFRVVDKLVMDVLDPDDNSFGLAEKFCEKYGISFEDRESELARLNELFSPEDDGANAKTRAQEVLKKEGGELVYFFKGIADRGEGTVIIKGYYGSNDVDSVLDRVVLLVRKIEEEYGERGES